MRYAPLLLLAGCAGGPTGLLPPAGLLPPGYSAAFPAPVLPAVKEARLRARVAALDAWREAVLGTVRAEVAAGAAQHEEGYGRMRDLLKALAVEERDLEQAREDKERTRYLSVLSPDLLVYAPIVEVGESAVRDAALDGAVQVDTVFVDAQRPDGMWVVRGGGEGTFSFSSQNAPYLIVHDVGAYALHARELSKARGALEEPARFRSEDLGTREGRAACLQASDQLTARGIRPERPGDAMHWLLGYGHLREIGHVLAAAADADAIPEERELVSLLTVAARPEYAEFTLGQAFGMLLEADAVPRHAAEAFCTTLVRADKQDPYADIGDLVDAPADWIARHADRLREQRLRGAREHARAEAAAKGR